MRYMTASDPLAPPGSLSPQATILQKSIGKLNKCNQDCIRGWFLDTPKLLHIWYTKKKKAGNRFGLGPKYLIGGYQRWVTLATSISSMTHFRGSARGVRTIVGCSGTQS